MKKNTGFLWFLLVFLATGLPSGNAQGLAQNTTSQEELAKEIDATIDEVNRLFEEEKTTKTELIDLKFNQANLEDVLKVISEASAQNILLDPTLKGKKIDLYLKGVSTEDALELLYGAYDLESTRIGNVLFVSTPEKIKRGAMKTKTIGLKNINSDHAKSLIGNLVSAVNLAEGSNKLVLVGSPQELAKAEKILKEVDVPQLQVLLEAKIIEIDHEALKELGIDWPDSLNFSFRESNVLPALASAAASSGPSPLAIHRMTRTALQFDAAIKMQETNNKAKILSSPRIATMNNKEAEIFIGDKIPYTVNTVTGGSVTTEVEWVEPGIRLKITPSVVDKDFVVIKIEPEVSYIFTFRGTGDQYPWIKSRQATAYVRVKNGEPFVIGGLLSKEDRKNLFNVPILGKIPLIGNLFSYEKTSSYNSDLIISVVPTISTDEQ